MTSRSRPLSSSPWITPFLPVCFALCTFHVSVQADDSDFFERKVRPLLIAKCGDCHGAEEPDGKLTLTSAAGIAKGGSLGAVLVSGKPEQSRLVQAVRYTSKLKMPPDAKLSDLEISILEKWAAEGAVLPGVNIPTPSAGQRDSSVITEDDRQWWAFQPIANPSPPVTAHEERVRTPVDRFILAKLEERGLALSPDATRQTLVRRVTFDLLGLPPTPEEVDAFVNDPRPDAYERLVERLLASPQYGERWGRHWLDVARYADTNGGGFDYVYPNAWHYRDYVVRAFNEDKPYDQFLLEQLAGDLLPVDCDNETYIERLKATGLLTLAPKGLGMQDKELMALDVVDDQIDVLGRSLMGLTLSCARCHDHKFDPISTEDYYALAGIFRSTTSLIDTDKNPSYWPERALELPAITKARKTYQDRKAGNEKAIAEEKRKANSAIISRARERLPEYLFAAARIRESTDPQAAIAHWTFDESSGEVADATVGPRGQLSNAGDPSGPKPAWAEGKLGRALRFAGQRDVVSIDAQQLDSLSFGTATDFSVSLWIKAAENYTPKTADSIIAAKYANAMWFIALRPGSYNGVYLRHYDGKRTADIKPSADQLPFLTDNRWHHIVFTSDRDGLGSVYVDGQRAGEVPIAAISSAATFGNAENFYIGASTNQFRGDMDDVAIWNRVLSPAEIRTFYQQAVDPKVKRSVAQVELVGAESRPSSGDEFTYEQAAQLGLVPSIVRRFVDLLTKSEGDPDAPLYELTEAPVKSLAEAKNFLDERSDPLAKTFADEKAGPFVLGDDATAFYAEATKARLAKLQEEARSIERTRVADPEMAMVAFDTSQPSDLRVHVAGDRKNLGNLVPRGFPRIVGQVCNHPDQPTELPHNQSGRRELAEWLTSSNHPLTARVFVNRVWQWHFGEGLVRTPDNFGRLGERPSHPALLDWLATRLIKSGWSVKELHRLILLSSTYRQSSESRAKEQSLDSGNRLLWRMNLRRLEGEAIRDAMLAVSGQLDSHLGGTVNTWKAKMFSVDDANAETANYDTRRRSIYLPVVRGAALHEMMQVFDFGDPNAITARRDVTTVATQALFLMNNAFVIEQAKTLANRVANEEDLDTTKRIALAYRLTLSRHPTASELQRAIAFVGEAQPEDWQLFCQMLLCLNEFAYIE